MADKKKLESSFKNMLIVLAAISLVSALAIGFTYTKTKPAAEKVQLENSKKALKEVLPAFEKLGEKYTVKVKEIEGKKGKYEVVGKDSKEGDELELTPAYKDEELVGTAVKTISHNGFGGDVQILVGFDAEGKIYNTWILLPIKETPGLGSNMKNSKFKDQVNGKDPENFKLSVKKDGGNVDAITAATISSRAFLDAVNKAVVAYKGGKIGGKDESME